MPCVHGSAPDVSASLGTGWGAEQPPVADQRDRGDFEGLRSQERVPDLSMVSSRWQLRRNVRPPNEPRVARREGAVVGTSPAGPPRPPDRVLMRGPCVASSLDAPAMDGERVLVRCPCVASPKHGPTMEGDRGLMRGTIPASRPDAPAMERDRVLMRCTSPGVTKKKHQAWNGIAS